jgi:parallel beta-helix repeat protein
VLGNQVSHCLDHGIKVQMTKLDTADATNITVANNTIQDVGGHAILLARLADATQTVRGATITGNTCSPTPRGDGITLIGVIGASIDNNVIDNARNGLRLHGCDQIEYSGNIFRSLTGIELIVGPYLSST